MKHPPLHRCVISNQASKYIRDDKNINQYEQPAKSRTHIEEHKIEQRKQP